MTKEPNPYQPPNEPTGPIITSPPPEDKMPVWAHFACGWPLILVAIGGLIGGVMGGVAYGVNATIFKSKLPMAAKVPLIILTGIVAVVIWFGIALAITIATS